MTGTYKKFPTACGHPAYETKKFGGKTFEPVDLTHIAQNVGKTSRQTCGACHFFGGGGDGIKHGDLNSLLVNPDKAIDVHMDAGGLNYSCTTCHTTDNHVIPGRYYVSPAQNTHQRAMPYDQENRIGCETCHGTAPHPQSATLNDHVATVSCQACHIPTIGKDGKSTLVGWDWSTAGKFDENHKFIVKKDAAGNVSYHTKKGDLTWNTSFIPEYRWYTGGMEYHCADAPVDAAGVVALNSPQGTYGSDGSKIFPFKVLRGKQVYDPVNNVLIVPKLFGPKATGAFWGNFDWEQSAKAGMAEVGKPFSGEIGFVETESYWPVNHMVAPKEDSLQCVACHSRNGRLAQLAGFYLPGRDSSPIVDTAGWIIVILTLVCVIAHSLLRVCCNTKEKGQS